MLQKIARSNEDDDTDLLPVLWRHILQSISLDDLKRMRLVNTFLAAHGMYVMTQEWTFSSYFVGSLMKSRIWPQIRRYRITRAKYNWFPPNLTHLTFSITFNRPILPNMLPDSITHLIFEAGFQQQLTASNLPRALQHITFHTHTTIQRVGFVLSLKLNVVSTRDIPSHITIEYKD